jgi:hypothetical protein
MKPSRRRSKNGGYGSPTNASDAIDDIELAPDASADDVLDEGLQETFPASDPIAVGKAYQRKTRAGF